MSLLSLPSMKGDTLGNFHSLFIPVPTDPDFIKCLLFFYTFLIYDFIFY